MENRGGVFEFAVFADGGSFAVAFGGRTGDAESGNGALG